MQNSEWNVRGDPTEQTDPTDLIGPIFPEAQQPMRSGRPRFPLKFLGVAGSKKVGIFKNIFAGYAGIVGYTDQDCAVCVGFCFLASFCVGRNPENFFRINTKVLPKVADKNFR